MAWMKDAALLAGCLATGLSACGTDPAVGDSSGATSAGSSEGEAESGSSEARLIIVLDVDETLPRLDNFGEPADDPPPGRAAQSPRFMSIAASSAELVPNAYTLLGAGAPLFDAPRREGVHDFSQLPRVTPGETLVSIPLSQVATGSYEYLRLAVAFQRYEVEGHADYMGIDVSADIDIASFVDDELYIDSFEIGDTSVSVQGVKSQGYYAAWSQYTGVVQGQAPVGATTVPNPLDATSPIPVESCVVTGVFDTPFVLAGDENEDIVLKVTMSTNRSFEWSDDNEDSLWQPFDESVVDMGLRGMVVEVGG